MANLSGKGATLPPVWCIFASKWSFVKEDFVKKLKIRGFSRERKLARNLHNYRLSTSAGVDEQMTREEKII